MKIALKVPEELEVELSELSSSLERPALQQPFSAETVDFCAALSDSLLKDTEARRFAELQALGFWLRRSQLLDLKRAFQDLSPADAVLAPRGLVFHVPPSNVEPMFVYSWAFAFLTGNASVVRLSSRPSPLTGLLCRLLRNLSSQPRFKGLHQGLIAVSYGHEDEPTAAFSKLCDLRVLWGGDDTVSRLRAAPLPPRARDLTFPDRASLCVLDAAKFLALSDARRRRLLLDFFNDAFWFDQRACASPRLVVWRGDKAKRERASREFFPAVAELARSRGIHFETGAVLKKLAFAYEAALEAPVASSRILSNELTVLPLSRLGSLPGEHCGAGLFFEAGIKDLDELARFVTEKDQTLTHFGLSKPELRKLAQGTRGLDRLVPVGQALAFHRFWDGYDLLRETTRLVHVQEGHEAGR